MGFERRSGGMTEEEFATWLDEAAVPLFDLFGCDVELLFDGTVVVVPHGRAPRMALGPAEARFVVGLMDEIKRAREARQAAAEGAPQAAETER